MSYTVSLAKLNDIAEIERLLHDSFNKFHLEHFYQNYDKKSVMDNLLRYLNSESLEIFKCEDKDFKIAGVSILIIYPQIYDTSIMQVQDLTLQPKCSLSNMEQSKVLIKLIKHMEIYAEEIKAKILGITINPVFDISNYLKRNDFKNCDTTYIKEVN